MKGVAGILVLCLMVPLTACQKRSYAADDRSQVHVGVVYDAGGKDDRSFNADAVMKPYLIATNSKPKCFRFIRGRQRQIDYGQRE